MKLRDLHNLFKKPEEGVPEKNPFFTGLMIGGGISLVVWIIMIEVVF